MMSLKMKGLCSVKESGSVQVEIGQVRVILDGSRANKKLQNANKAK